MIEAIIVGAGGHAAEIDEYIRYSNKVNKDDGSLIEVKGFLDDNPENYARYKFSAPLIDPINGHKVIPEIKYIIGIANLDHRKRIILKMDSLGADFLSFIHPGAYISESSIIGKGSIIGPNANIGPNVIIGKYNLINSRCSLGHDTKIGDYNFICPNVCMSGFTVCRRRKSVWDQ
jgi:hypothetical protein